MWTRRSVFTSGPEKLRLLLRSISHGRYLQSHESSLQASTGSSLRCARSSLESHALYQENQQNSAEFHSQHVPTSASTSCKSFIKQELSRPTDRCLNSESIFLSPNFCSSRLGHLSSGDNVKEQDRLSASGRHFRSLSYSCSEDERSPETLDATHDGAHPLNRVAGASETWHTKLSAILANDPLSASGASTVSESTSPARMIATVLEHDRRSSGGTRIGHRNRSTHFSVCQRIRNEKDIEVAWRYFTWVGKQEGYKHGGETYNTMIQALCEAKRFSSVFELLENMRAHGFSLSYSTCLKIMKTLTSERMYGKAIAFFKDIGNYGCKPNVVVYNSFFDILVKAGHYNLVEVTFAAMIQEGISPDVYTYNIVINAFRKAHEVEKALRMYEEMKQKGWTPSVVTINTIIHALGKAGRTDEALELFCEMGEKDLVPSAFTYSILLDIFRNDWKHKSSRWNARSRPSRTNQEIPSRTNVYRNLVWTLCKKHDLASALRGLKEMESQGHTISLATYNLFAAFLGDAGENDAVMDLFRTMRAKNCEPDALTYRTAVQAACRTQKVGEALLLHKEMVGKGHAVAVGTWNMLIDVAAKAGQVDTAFELFSQMQQTCKPDIYAYNSLISTLCNLGKDTDALACLNRAGVTSHVITSGEQGALELFRQMKEVIAPDAVTYHTLIHALCRSGRVQDCQDLLLEMEENGFDPGVLVYNKVLNVLGRAGKVDKAWKLFLKMQSHNVSDLITYTTLIKFLAKAGSFGKATKLLEDMERKGFVPNIVTFTTLVDGLAKSRRFAEADKLMKDMSQRGCYPDTYAFNSVIDAYCKAGQVAKAHRIFEERIDKGYLPDTYTYTSLINGYFKFGNINDALDMYRVMTSMGCKPSGVTYNILLEGLSKAGRVVEVEQILEEISQSRVATTDVSTKCMDRALSLTRGTAKVAITV